MRSSRVLPIFPAVAVAVLLGGHGAWAQQETRGLDLQSQPVAGRGWAVVIGVNEYLDPRIPNLKYCVADARLVFETLTKHGGFDPARVLLIVDDQPRAHLRPLRVNLQQQIGDWLDQARPEDTVVIHFSGHGFVDPDTDEGFLAPADTMQDDLRRTGFPTERLRQMLRNCKARQKLLVLDCCFAGAVRDGKPAGSSAAELSVAFQDARGLITLASSRKDQVSYEWEAKRQGVFTYFLAKGMAGAADYDQDGVVNVDELYRYTYELVRQTAQRELNARQHPVRIIGPDTEGIFALTRVAVVPRPLEAMPPVVFEIREEDPKGRLLEGALVEIFRRPPDGGQAELLGSGRSGADGRLTVEVPTTAQQPGRDLAARVSLEDAQRTFALEGFPQVRSFRLYLPQASPATPLRTTPFQSPISPFGRPTPGWEQVGPLQNNVHEIEQKKVAVAGDFVLRFTTGSAHGPHRRGDEPGFRITLLGTGGGDDLVFEGTLVNRWSGVDTWNFSTPGRQTRKGLTPGTRTLILKRQGELVTLEADSVFNPHINNTTIAEFATGSAKTFLGIRLLITKNLAPERIRIDPLP